MEKIELKKDNGDVFLEVERMADNSYVYANWIGLQSIDTVKEGGNLFLKLMLEKPYSKLLNSNKEVVGPWKVANDWVAEEWMPKITKLGLRYLAQVLGPGIYSQMTFQELRPRINGLLETRMFQDDEAAAEWLLRQD